MTKKIQMAAETTLILDFILVKQMFGFGCISRQGCMAVFFRPFALLNIWSPQKGEIGMNI